MFGIVQDPKCLVPNMRNIPEKTYTHIHTNAGLIIVRLISLAIISAAGRGSIGQEMAASPLGPIDIVGYGEGDVLHTDEVLDTKEKEPPTSYITAVLEEARAKATSPAKSAGAKSQVNALPKYGTNFKVKK